MKAISMWQPWAQWVVMGWKTVETRIHYGFASLVGKRICIHAAAEYETWAIAKANKYLSKHQIRKTILMDEIEPSLIGTVYVYGMADVSTTESKKALFDIPPYGLIGLFLKEAKEFETPIPYRGKQGIFNVPDKVVADADL